MEKLHSAFYLPLLLALAMLPAASECRGENITLSWSASPGPVTGYILFWGEQSVLSNPSASQNVGTALQHTISDLETGRTYYFALKAYNAYGQSDFSNQLVHTIGSPISTTTTIGWPLKKPKKPKTILAAKGSNPMDGAAAAAFQPGWEAAFTPDDEAAYAAITVFDNSDELLQIPVDWPEYTALNGEARIAVGDIDGDGNEEMIIGLGPVEGHSGIPGGKFQIIDDDFTPLGWGQISWNEYNSMNGESWPACGDLDGDGRDEILIGLGVGGNGIIEIFKFTKGKAVHEAWLTSTWKDYCSAGGGVRPACGAIGPTPRSSIVLGLYPVGDIFKSEGKFEIMDLKAGHLAWGSIDWPEYNWANGETWPVCADINRTMRDEILLGLGNGSNGKIPLFSFVKGTVEQKAWLEAGTDEYRQLSGETRLAAGDFDFDGLDEILIGFGRDGQGRIELHDDGLNNFSLLKALQLPDQDYNIANGETYPGFKGSDRNIPRFIRFFMKTLRKRSSALP